MGLLFAPEGGRVFLIFKGFVVVAFRLGFTCVQISIFLYDFLYFKRLCFFLIRSGQILTG